MNIPHKSRQLQAVYHHRAPLVWLPRRRRQSRCAEGAEDRRDQHQQMPWTNLTMYLKTGTRMLIWMDEYRLLAKEITLPYLPPQVTKSSFVICCVGQGYVPFGVWYVWNIHLHVTHCKKYSHFAIIVFYTQTGSWNKMWYICHHMYSGVQ